MSRLILFVINILCCIIFIGCGGSDSIEDYDAVLDLNGNKLYIEIADDEETRELGLMFRKELHRDKGILFIFEKEQNLSFWMKNTMIPLSIAYIKENGIISQIFDMQPYDERPHKSKEKVIYALEVNKGWFSENNITTGYRIEFPVTIREK